MKAVIESNRRGSRTQHTNQFILLVENVKTKEEAAKLLGKKVVWKTERGADIVGKITRVHGNKGAVVARFEKGLPGQALGTKAEII